MKSPRHFDHGGTFWSGITSTIDPLGKKWRIEVTFTLLLWRLSSVWSEQSDGRFSAICGDDHHLSRLRALGGIDHHSIVANDGTGRQARLIDMRFSENVLHLFARGEKVVGNDPAVAAPPDRFSAHDRAAVLTASFPEPGQAGGEGGRQGVVRIVPKAAHPPICVGRKLSGARLPTAAPEFGDMLVADLPSL